MRLKIYPYKLSSISAKTLARALKVKRIIPGGGYVPGRNTMVINWGSTTVPCEFGRVLNTPAAVENAADKLSTFYTLAQSGVPTPDFTSNSADAQRWQELGFRVVVRHSTTSHSGRGIEIVRPDEELPRQAPLYTKYMKKQHEYRVHVFRGEVIDISEKRKRLGATDAHPLIRNHENGWVFCRDGLDAPDAVHKESIRAVKALRLDFGAVDIIQCDNKAYVLEVNTAPGIEGTTLLAYVKAIKEVVYATKVYDGRAGYFRRRG